MKTTDSGFLKIFQKANIALEKMESPTHRDLEVDFTGDGHKVNLYRFFVNLYEINLDWYFKKIVPFILDFEYSAQLFNVFFEKVASYGPEQFRIEEKFPYHVLDSFGLKEIKSEYFNTFMDLTKSIYSYSDTKYLSQLYLGRFDQVTAIYNSQVEKCEQNERRISTPDQFAKEFFGYYSFESLVGSIDILFKTAPLSQNKIKDISSQYFNIYESYIKNIADVMLSINKGVSAQNQYFNFKKTIEKYFSNHRLSMNHPFSSISMTNRGYFMWPTEGTTFLLSELDLNFNTVSFYVDGIKLAVIESEDKEKIEHFFGQINLGEHSIFSLSFFDYSELGRKVFDYIYEVIEKKHNQITPIIIENYIQKINNIKQKYKSALKISDDVINKLISDKYLDQPEVRLEWLLEEPYLSSFKNNRTFLKSKSTYFMGESTPKNYFALIRSAFPTREYVQKIHDIVNNGDESISLDLFEIFKDYFEASNVESTFGNLADEYYLSPNLFKSFDKNLLKDLYPIINGGLRTKLTYLVDYDKNNDEGVSFETLTNMLGRIEGSEKSGSSTPQFSGQTSLADELKVARFSSRLMLMGGRSYKDFVKDIEESYRDGGNMDKFFEIVYQRKAKNLSPEDPAVIEQYNSKIDNVNHIFKKLTQLSLEYFKKESASLDKEEEKNLNVKFLKSNEAGEIGTGSSQKSFSELVLLVNSFRGSNDSELSYTRSAFYSELASSIVFKYLNKEGPTEDVYRYAVFWILELSRLNSNSSIKEIEESLNTFIQNLPIIITLFRENPTLYKIIGYSHLTGSDYRSGSDLEPVIAKKFIEQSKDSNMETLKNLSSIIDFYHNYESNSDIKIILETRYFNKLYLKKYQSLLEVYLNILSLMRQGIPDSGESSDYYRDYFSRKTSFKFSSPRELRDAIIEFKKGLLSDPDFGTENAEKLLPESRMKFLELLDLDSLTSSGKDFDSLANKFGQSIDENFSTVFINLVHNFFSIIKQINDIKKYVGFVKPKDKNVVENNYAFATEGSKIRFRTLGDYDPQHFSIGAETDCCQRIGGPGEAAAVDSYINPLAGVIILEAYDNGDWKIASQSYFHYVPNLNYIILDNIEAGSPNFNTKTFKLKTGISFRDAYGMLGRAMLNKGYSRVLCGTAHTLVIGSNDFKLVSIDEDPRYFEIDEQGLDEHYTDFEEDSSYDLGKPLFDVPNLNSIKFAGVISNNPMIKIAKIISKVGKKQTIVRGFYKKITTLSSLLVELGLRKEALEVKNLSEGGIPSWLSLWRDTMRHYGFQNFGRDKKWWKGKSYLEEPMDKISAEHDIHMVEQAHSPDAEGRRISDKSLDTFMKEFYGEKIWIAPREGWKKNITDDVDE